MRTLHAALLTALSILCSAHLVPAARAVELDQVLQRLESLERENAALRNRLERLEGSRRPDRGATPAVAAPAVIAALPPSSPLAAHAAVPAYKGAVPAVPAFNWTGFYIGVHGGGVWQTDSLTDAYSVCFASCALAPAVRDIEVDGFLAGLHGGWNYQVGNLVVGTEASIAWAKRDGDRNDTLSVADPFGALVARESGSRTWTSESEWLATATARLGYAWNTLLLYSKGGVAASRSRYTLVDVNQQTLTTTTVDTTNATGSDTRVGYTVGVGGEWAFTNNLSAILGYDFVDFGTDTVRMSGRTVRTGFGGPATAPVEGAFPIEQYLHILKAGITYRFGSNVTP